MIRSSILLALVWGALPLHAEIKVGDALQVYLKGVPASEKPKVDGRYVVGESGTIRVPLADAGPEARTLSTPLPPTD